MSLGLDRVIGVARKLGVHRRMVREAVRNAVPAQRKKTEHEVFVPQSYDWAVEAQVDWYEAYADLDGERIQLQVFEMRSMASGAAFHRAYPCATQQAFWKRMNLLSSISKGSSVGFATITCRAQ